MLALPAAAVSSSDGEVQHEEADEEQSSWGLGDVDWESPQSEEWYQECLDFECFRDRYTKQARVDCVRLQSMFVVAEATYVVKVAALMITPATMDSAQQEDRDWRTSIVKSNNPAVALPGLSTHNAYHMTACCYTMWL